MKQWLFILFILRSGTMLAQTTYYVAANGNDHNKGTSPSTPFKSVLKITQTPLNHIMKPGDRVLFRRGDVFPCGSDNVNINIRVSGTSGNPIIIGAYGSGSNPIIDGTIDLPDWKKSSSWKNTKGNIWRIPFGDNVHRLWVDGTEWGRNPNSCTPDATERFGSDGKYIYLYSPSGNPAKTFSTIQKVLDVSGISGHDQGYVTIEDLDIRRFAGGTDLEGCHDILLQRDSIGWDCEGTGSYWRRSDAGNNTNDILIRNCTFNTNDHIWHSFEAKATEDGVYCSEGTNKLIVDKCRFINWGHAANYMLCHGGTGYHITNCEFRNSFYTSPDINYGYGPCADLLDYQSTGNKIHGNYVYKTGNALQINGPYIEVFNNVIDGTYGHSFYSYPESSGIDLTGYYAYPQHMKFYNNTIVNCNGYGIQLHNGNGDSILEHNLFANNILAYNKGELVNQRGSFTYQQLLIEGNPEIKSNTFKNNLLYYPSVTKLVHYRNKLNENFAITVQEFNSMNGKNGDIISGNTTGDPLLDSNYQLQAGSPAIGAGMDLGTGTDLGAYSYKKGDQPGNSTH